MLTRRSALIAMSAALGTRLIPNAQAQPQPAKPASLVILGDSITAGYGLPRAQAYPAVLEGLLRKQRLDVRLINAGVSGDTLSGGLARLDWSVPKTATGVLIALGGNDMLSATDPAISRAALDKILSKLRDRGQKAAILGMRAGANWGSDFARRFDAIFPDLARQYKLPLYPFLLEGVALDARLNQDDGIHPNAAGAKLIAERLAPFVIKAFGLSPGAASPV